MAHERETPLARLTCHPAFPLRLAAAQQRSEEQQQRGASLLLSLAASAALVLGAGPASADVKLPPLDNGAAGCLPGLTPRRMIIIQSWALSPAAPPTRVLYDMRIP